MDGPGLRFFKTIESIGTDLACVFFKTIEAIGTDFLCVFFKDNRDNRDNFLTC